MGEINPSLAKPPITGVLAKPRLIVRRPAIAWFNCTLRNKFQRNSNKIGNFLILENVFENVVCEIATILFRGRWAKRQHILSVNLAKSRSLAENGLIVLKFGRRLLKTA